jgi:hypothetical protein
MHQQISASHPVDMDNYNELRESTANLKEAYEVVFEAGANHGRNSVRSPTVATMPSPPLAQPPSIDAQIKFIQSLSIPEEIAPQVLELLVALSALLTIGDYKRMAKWLWSTCLDGSIVSIIAPVRVLL